METSSTLPQSLALSDRQSPLDLDLLYPALKQFCPHRASPKQTIFLLLENREAFYGGAAGGGKSDAGLMGALQHVDKPGYAALLLRRTYAELSKADGLIPRSHQWLSGTSARWNEDRKTWTFPSGARIEFGHVETENDKFKYQSAAYQYIFFDELTSFSETQYEYIGFTRARRSADSDIPIRTRAASNPGNVGHAWVQSRFIDNREPGVIFIPARVIENPGLDVADYTASLESIDEVLRKQLLEGDWGAIEGAAFAIRPEHQIATFKIPSQWEQFESMDYGLTNPTAWLCWLIDYDGNLIAYDLHYKPGLPSETSPVILNKRRQWSPSRYPVCWGDPASLAMPTSTLSKLGTPATISTEFAERGLHLTPANNNRQTGFTRLKEFLRFDPTRTYPHWHPKHPAKGAPRMFIVMPNCLELVKQLKVAPVQPIGDRLGGEAIDRDWEGQYGHAVAAARYGVMSRFPAPRRDPQMPSDPQARLLYVHEKRMENAEKVKQTYEWR